MGVISTRPHRLMSALMRLGPRLPVSFLPMTAYAASHSTAPTISRLPQKWLFDAKSASCADSMGVGSSDFVSASKAMPSTPQAIAAPVRRVMRSPSSSQPSSATEAGIAAKITPADTALVSPMPYSMQIENRKFPRNDSRNTSQRVCADRGPSEAGFFSQGSMAMAAMPKRSQASKNTGSAATSGLLKPTYTPTRAMPAARQRRAVRGEGWNMYYGFDSCLRPIYKR